MQQEPGIAETADSLPSAMLPVLRPPVSLCAVLVMPDAVCAAWPAVHATRCMVPARVSLTRTCICAPLVAYAQNAVFFAIFAIFAQHAHWGRQRLRPGAPPRIAVYGCVCRRPARFPLRMRIGLARTIGLDVR